MKKIVRMLDNPGPVLVRDVREWDGMTSQRLGLAAAGGADESADEGDSYKSEEGGEEGEDNHGSFSRLRRRGRHGGCQS